MIDINIAFAADGNKICLPITEVLLCAAAGNLARPKKQQDWTPRNAVLHLKFITEAEILDGGTYEGDLLKIFACSVTERTEDGEEYSGDNGNDNSKEGEEEEENKKYKMVKKKHSTAETLATIGYNCNDVLAFLQSAVVK